MSIERTREDVRDSARSFFDKHAIYSVDVTEPDISVSGKTAMATFSYSLDLKPEGDPRRVITYPETKWVFRQVKGQWYISEVSADPWAGE